MAREKGYKQEEYVPQKRVLHDIIHNPVKFVNRLKVVDKAGKLVRLKLNCEQIKIIETLWEGKDVLILKPRQIGASTAVAGYFFWRWYTTKDPETFIVLSHKNASARHLLEIHKRFYQTLPAPLKKPLANDNGGELRMLDSGATISAMSAEAKGGLRSFSANALHISEYAFASRASELKATAVAALNGGQLVIESTANFYGDPLHKEIQLFRSGIVDWKFLFFPWTEHVDYCTPHRLIPDTFIPEPGSELTPGQQHWREKLSGQLGESKFRREYPSNIDEAYLAVEGAWLGANDFKTLNIIGLERSGGILDKPRVCERYGIGVDTAGGVGQDFSVLVVVSSLTGQIVEIRRSNTTPPAAFAEWIIDASKKWNNAKVLVESNGTYGGIILTELRKANVSLWKTSAGNDWVTTGPTKIKLLEELKSQIISGRLIHIDGHIAAELRAFRVDPARGGAPFCPRTDTGHGDSVIALGLAIQCIKNVSTTPKAYLPQWIIKQSRDAAFNRAGKRFLGKYTKV